jgi:esterase
MFGAEPCVVIGHSYGATVSLLAAIEAGPAVFSAAIGHEPPFFAALKGDPVHAALHAEIGATMAEAARLIEGDQVSACVELFVDRVGFGPDAWRTTFLAQHREVMVANAHTWLDQFHDPQRLALTSRKLTAAARHCSSRTAPSACQPSGRRSMRPWPVLSTSRASPLMVLVTLHP